MNRNETGQLYTGLTGRNVTDSESSYSIYGGETTAKPKTSCWGGVKLADKRPAIARTVRRRLLLNPTALSMLNVAAPFFIVDDLAATVAFYESKLGFNVLYRGGGEEGGGDFYAIMGRDRVMLMFKAIAPEVHPQPNRSRHEWARWDAYIGTDDPDSLYTEFADREVPMHRELANTSDGLRAFEISDNNGYVLCFGRPRET